jgi:hypothetical protein
MGIPDGSELIKNVDGGEFAQALMNYNQVVGNQGSPPAGPPQPGTPAEATQQQAGMPA